MTEEYCSPDVHQSKTVKKASSHIHSRKTQAIIEAHKATIKELVSLDTAGSEERRAGAFQAQYVGATRAESRKDGSRTVVEGKGVATKNVDEERTSETEDSEGSVSSSVTIVRQGTSTTSLYRDELDDRSAVTHAAIAEVHKYTTQALEATHEASIRGILSLRGEPDPSLAFSSQYIHGSERSRSTTLDSASHFCGTQDTYRSCQEHRRTFAIPMDRTTPKEIPCSLTQDIFQMSLRPYIPTSVDDLSSHILSSSTYKAVQSSSDTGEIVICDTSNSPTLQSGTEAIDTGRKEPQFEYTTEKPKSSQKLNQNTEGSSKSRLTSVKTRMQRLFRRRERRTSKPDVGCDTTPGAVTRSERRYTYYTYVHARNYSVAHL